MKKFFAVLLISLFLLGCTSKLQPTTTPTITATPLPTITATATPTPTVTPILTPTPKPDDITGLSFNQYLSLKGWSLIENKSITPVAGNPVDEGYIGGNEYLYQNPNDPYYAIQNDPAHEFYRLTMGIYKYSNPEAVRKIYDPLRKMYDSNDYPQLIDPNKIELNLTGECFSSVGIMDTTPGRNFSFITTNCLKDNYFIMISLAKYEKNTLQAQFYKNAVELALKDA